MGVCILRVSFVAVTAASFGVLVFEFLKFAVH